MNDTSRHDKPALPADAVAAALAAVRSRHDDEDEFRKDVEEDRDMMLLDTVAALEAAAPAIRDQATAAEREACAQLAEQHHVRYSERKICHCARGPHEYTVGPPLPLADLIRARTTQ